MPMTNEQVDAIEELIRAVVVDMMEEDADQSGLLYKVLADGHRARIAVAKAALRGEQPQAGDAADASKPGEIEVTRDQMIAGRAAFNKTYTNGDEQLTAIYRAMRAAEPTRPVTDEEIDTAMMKVSGVDVGGIYRLSVPTRSTIRAALEDFAKRRG